MSGLGRVTTVQFMTVQCPHPNPILYHPFERSWLSLVCKLYYPINYLSYTYILLFKLIIIVLINEQDVWRRD